jgi:hypothetical protein
MGKNEKQVMISDMFKLFQGNINKRSSFETGIKNLLDLRDILMNLKNEQSFEHNLWKSAALEDFTSMPLQKDKTIAYYMYHLARIEDITSNLLIEKKDQIFYLNNYESRLETPITTTGNELLGEEIITFSKKLNLEELNNYRLEVYLQTNEIIKNLDYNMAKTKVAKEDIDKILQQNSVSTHPDAVWLLDYWGSKNYIGLLLMPFSRHQMLHLDGCFRILSKLGKIN